MMKKYVIFAVVLIGLFVCIPVSVDAKTIADFQSEINGLEAKQQSASNKSAVIQKEIDDAKAEMAELTRKTSEAIKNQKETKEEIEKLNKEIDAKKEEIKDLVAFYQVSENENFYLKYVFGAESFEDFIYRFAVAEQLTDANDQLVTEMNDLIAQNKIKVKELKKQEKKLGQLNDKMKVQVAKLGDQKGEYLDSYIDAGAEIKALKKKIKYYRDSGCGENEEISSCMSTTVPYDFGFARPLKHGFVTYEFGVLDPAYAIGFHKGIDLGGNGEGTPVYAVAAGRVVATMSRLSCGGNMVFINHTVNGTDYTSGYYHMLSINVSDGEVVSKGEQIGTVGGGGSTYWDGCSFGAHLHLDMVYGHYYVDYFSFSDYVSHVFNPRNLIYFPINW